MPEFTDSPSPEVAAERQRILDIISCWQLSPDGAGVRSKAFTAIRNGLTLEQCLEKSWGHPWVVQP